MAPLTDLDEANTKIVELSSEIERLREQLRLMRQRMFGRRREVIDPNQLMLFEAGIAQLEKLQQQAGEQTTPAPEEPKGSKKKPGHGRAPFAEHLPREEIELDLTEEERCCPDCGEVMHRIGTDVTERGHMIPARVMGKRYVRPKYGCRQGHAVKSAPMPPGVVDKAKYEPSVYAHIVTAKYGDHLPLHRLQGIFRRFGAHLPKQSMWDMLVRFDEIAAKPILAEMRRQLLEEDVLQADETPVKVQLEDQRGTRRGTLWVWRSARGSPNEMSVADFKDDRSAKGPDAFLGDWTGTLLTDGYDGVNPTARQNAITRAGCWAHARRKFRDALTAGATRAGLALRPIQRLFWIERAVVGRAEKKKLDRDQLIELRQAVRNRRSKVVLRKLYEIVFALQEDPSTKASDQLCKAVNYAVNQRDSLLAHLDDGRLPIHNNDTERDLRHVVTGRKNWQIFGSERGGQVAARLYSLVISCKLAKVNVETYLEDVLIAVATTPASRVAELTPWGWAKARAASQEA